jgi:hypothetical protein
MDARQSGIHRAAFAYGTSYAIVLPGDPVPVIRGASPRNLTAVYGEDPDWPMWALEKLGGGLWRLYDDQAIYFLGESTDARTAGDFQFIETREHNSASRRSCATSTSTTSTPTTTSSRRTRVGANQTKFRCAARSHR